MGGKGSGARAGSQSTRKSTKTWERKTGAMDFESVARKYNETHPWRFEPSAIEMLSGRISALTTKNNDIK